MKIVWDLCIIVYVILSVFITICLLSYNEYNVTEFGDRVLVIVKNDNTSNYEEGDLIVATKSDAYKIGDEVFYYIQRGKKYYINFGKIENQRNHSVIIDNEVIEDKFLIGNDKDIQVIPKVGSVLSFLESKWGYLSIIILPILVAFLYEVYSILKELRKGK